MEVSVEQAAQGSDRRLDHDDPSSPTQHGLLQEHARPIEMVQHVKHRDIVETSGSEGQALRIG
jgi:hypothetical protein